MKVRYAATFVALFALVLASCYKIAEIVQDHELTCGDTFHARVVVDSDNSMTMGGVRHVYGLLGVCVPQGWQPEGDAVMTQVPKPGTDLGDDEYSQTITRRLLPCDDYARYLNECFPKDGYEWLGYVTDAPFKSMFCTEDESKEVDYIVAEVAIRTNDRAGRFYIDYVAGQIDHEKLDQIGRADLDWETRAANFRGKNISNGTRHDTHIDMLRADGSMPEPKPGFEPRAEWNLQLMPDATRGDSHVYAYRDLMYDDLFTRYAGWNGGDGVYTAPLPNGDVFWTFNDSFYGKVREADRSRIDCNFPRNSVMVQRAGADGLPGESPNDQIWLADYVHWLHASNTKYMQCRTHLRHPGGECTDEEIRNGVIDQGKVYWSGEGIIYDGKLQWLWFGVQSNTLENLGNTALATYRLDGNIPTKYYSSAIPDYLPKEGNYMYMESVDHYLRTGCTVSYGSTLWQDEDSHVYLYATYGTNMVVARTATHDLSSEWEYYARDSRDADFRWQKDVPTKEQLEASNIMADNVGVALPWVFEHNGMYYMITQAPIFGHHVNIYRSATPYGPFDDERCLFLLPDTIDKIGDGNYKTVYMVNLHRALSRNGELVFSTNTEADDFWMNFNDPGSADWYRPFFYRVFGWENLYGIECESGVEPLPSPADATPADDRYYNLQGIPVTHPTRGNIYIHNGRKFLSR